MYSTDGTFCKVLAEFILVRFVLNYGLHANEALFCKDFMRWEMYCPKGSGKVAAREVCQVVHSRIHAHAVSTFNRPPLTYTTTGPRRLGPRSLA